MINVISKQGFQRYFWTSIILFIGIAVGVILVSCFAYSQKVDAFSPLLWSSAYYAIGGLFGFIFSVPKIIADNPQVGISEVNNKAYMARSKVEENTNLTQISDWLTKILIGAGLVQLKEAPGFILKVAQYMGKGMRNGTSDILTIDNVTIMCASIILFFLTWGFISGYLIMKLVLTKQFAFADDNLDNDV